MLQSNEFNTSVFKDTEGHLRDRKEKLYPLLSENKELGEFIKDVIALANSARQRGRDAYILFGVANNRTIVGIEGQDIKAPPRDTASGTTETDIEHHQLEIVGRVILKKITDHIGRFGARYEYGYVEGHLVSYLCLPGRTPAQWHDTPYQTSKDVIGPQSKQVIYTAGSCWTREGETNVQVSEFEKKNLYCYEKMPYVGSQQWSIYVQEITKLFNSVNETPIIPLQCECSDSDEQDLLKTLHLCLQESKPRNILCNLPGSGKTTLLKQFISDLARDLEGEIATLQQRREDNEPILPIPIYFSLEGYTYQQRGSIMQCLLHDIKQKGVMVNEEPDQLAKLFNNQKMCFVIILDSFDEMAQDDWQQNKGAVQTFIEEMTNRMTVFIGCRSIFIQHIPKCDTFQKIKVLPVQERLMYEYLEETMKSINGLVDSFETDTELYRLAVRPLMLEAIRDYSNYTIDDTSFAEEQAAINSIRLFSIIDHVVNYVLRSEYRKHQFSGIFIEDRAVEEISQRLGKLAVQMVRQGSIRTVQPPDTELIDWCSRANLLYIREKPREICFLSGLLKDYFTAIGIVFQGMKIKKAKLSPRVITLMREAELQTVY